MAVARQMCEARADRQLEDAQRENPEILENHLRAGSESRIPRADHRGEGRAVTRPSGIEELVQNGLGLKGARTDLGGHRHFRGRRLWRGRRARPDPARTRLEIRATATTRISCEVAADPV